MPTLIIQTQDDGSVLVAATAQPLPPELLAGAEQVQSLDEAAAMVPAVLGDGEQQAASPEGAEPAPAGEDEEDDAFSGGYRAAARGQ